MALWLVGGINYHGDPTDVLPAIMPLDPYAPSDILAAAKKRLKQYSRNVRNGRAKKPALHKSTGLIAV
jgi:hypothetical protein